MNLPRLTAQTFRELLRPRCLGTAAFFTALIWLGTCGLYKMATYGAPFRVWGLDAWWQEQLRSEQRWIEESRERVPDFPFRFSPNTSRSWLQGSHAGAAATANLLAGTLLLSLLAALLASMFSDRLFRRGELALYLVRPLDRLQLYAARCLALYVFLALLAALCTVVFVAGAFSEDWRAGRLVAVPLLQAELIILLPVTVLPHCFAPFSANLMRGAGTFVLSTVTLGMSALIRPAATLWEGLAPIAWPAAGTAAHKGAVVVQTALLLPLPRIYFAAGGAAKCFEDLQRGLDDLPALAVSHAGFWYWSAASGIALALLGAVSWWRKESE
ncbi:MAG: hypothetical protein HYV63_32075 [Candidatus Schekmanbacteria bacterium]|nr:hypothetical protein [Candidatus Schekmanbacteria bacterium]